MSVCSNLQTTFISTTQGWQIIDGNPTNVVADDTIIHDVQIERCGHSIHTTVGYTAATAGNFNQINIECVDVRESVMGIQFNAVHDSHIRHCNISVDYTAFSDADNRLHCIYANNSIQNCEFSHLTLRNANGGHAIILKGGKAELDNQPTVLLVSKNIRVHDITAHACHSVIGTDYRVENVFADRIAATCVRQRGIRLCGVQNAVFSDCLFVGDPTRLNVDDENSTDIANGGFEIESDDFGNAPGALVRNVTIRNCVFDFPQIFFRIEQNRADNCEGIRVVNCLFKIHHPCLSEKKTPAYIKGIVKDIRFVGCRFEAEGFTTESHSRNGVLFFFAARLAEEARNPDGSLIHPAIPNTMHWFFDRCSFVNNGTISVNSAMLSHRAVDYHNTVYCRIRNCIFEGFRWTIRIARTVESSASATSTNINPCFNGYNTDYQALAVIYLNDKGRFVSKDNIYRKTVSEYVTSYSYVRAEEYGI